MRQKLRFDLIRSLIKKSKLSKERREQAADLIDAVAALWRTRTKIIHCYAGERTLPTRVEYLLHEHKPALKNKELTEIPLPIESLEEHAEKISELGEKIITLAHWDFYRPNIL